MFHTNIKEDYRYKHFNRSFGCQVESKAHYEYLMKKGGYVPYEEAIQIAKDYDRNQKIKDNKRPELSAKAVDIIKSLRQTADSKGNIKLGLRAINALREIGAIPTEKQVEQMNKFFKEESLYGREV